MLAPILNSAGLVLGMTGAVLLFIFGNPQPTHEEGLGLGLEDGTVLSDRRTVAERNREIRQVRERYFFWSRVGIALIFFSFLLQLVTTWSG